MVSYLCYGSAKNQAVYSPINQTKDDCLHWTKVVGFQALIYVRGQIQEGDIIQGISELASV